MCGFLRGQGSPQPEASRKICGISGKRKATQEPVSNAGAGEVVALKDPSPDNKKDGQRLADPTQRKRRQFALPQKDESPPRCGPRPIVEMVLHWHPNQRRVVRVLLDTGCTTPLIDTDLVARSDLRCLKHQQKIEIRNFTGELVQGAGELYPKPAILQHRRHFTKEVFEVTPLEPGVDVFLPITKHALPGRLGPSGCSIQQPILPGTLHQISC